jgi:hypothetical protein
MRVTRSPSTSATPNSWGVLDPGEQDLSAARLCGERLDVRPDAVLDDVVAEHDDDAVVVGEMLGQAERLGDAALAFLVGVVELLEAERLPVAEQAEELARVLAARDDHDVVEPGVDERLDRVVDHRLVVDGQQVLVRDGRERAEARAQSAGQDDAFHLTPP